MKYKITKAQCQKAINERNYVCDYCGGDIVPIRTVNNANEPTYWAGCYHGGEGGNFTSGVPLETFQQAERLICAGERAYSHLNKQEFWTLPEMKLYWFRQQVSGMCSFLRNAEYYKHHPAKFTKDEFLAEKY